MIVSYFGKRAFSSILRSLDGRIDKGELTIILPDQSTHSVKGNAPGPLAELHIHDYRFMRRILRFGSVGFAEAFMEQDCSSPNMRAVLDFAVANTRWFDSGAASSQGFANFIMRRLHNQRDNSRDGSKKNISYHYDLGNDFYALWLDSSMTYSSAIFSDGINSLEAAQREKYDRLAKLVDLKPGARVLEIGCGWGGFAEHAARNYGAMVTGLTISQEQLDFAKERMTKAGLTKQVDLRFCDYREHEVKNYDAVISIEMFEAVGERHWSTFFNQLNKFLKPGGNAGLQIITIEKDYYEDYRASPDFIQKYIFPGGMLPTPEHLDGLASDVGFSRQASNGYGHDYARTLEAWLFNFQAHWKKIHEMGFDEKFKRMWEYYLDYCAAGFMDGRLDVKQIRFQKPRNLAG